MSTLTLKRHVLPSLPYDYCALQPWIDEQTMRIHHGYHHLRFVEELNAAQARLEAAWQSGDISLVRHFQQLVATHESAHALHALFWETMGPNQGGQPRGELTDQISEDFGSFATFKSCFSAAASSLETGGWVMLAWQPKSQQLAIRAAEGYRLDAGVDAGALLVLDVAEHAYYLKYQHRRAEYVHNWWNTVHWPRVMQRFAVAVQSGSGSVGNSTFGCAAPKRRQSHVSSTAATSPFDPRAAVASTVSPR